MPRRLALWLVFGGVLLAAGCPSRRPTRAGDLVIGQIATAVTLDPHLHDELPTHSCLAHFYNKLVTFGPDLEVLPELATHWDNPVDTVWRFYLRRGVTFHDGRPFGAADVVASLQRAQRMPGSPVRYYLDSVEDVQAVGDSIVELRTGFPRPVLLNKLVFVSIVPRDTPWTPISHPVGTGAYRYVSGTAGDVLRGERYPGFWGRPPAFERVTIVPFPNDLLRAEAVERGKADIVSTFPQEHWLAMQGRSGFRLISRPGLGVAMLGFSLRPDSPFADPRVRRAVALTVDRDLIVTRGLLGLGAPIEQVVPPGVFGYSREISPTRRDVAQAKKLLRDARRDGGFDTKCLMPESTEPIGRDVIAQLREVGIRLTPVVVAWPSFRRLWTRDAPPLVLFSWAAATGDVSDAWDDLLRPPGEGASNLLSYQSPRFTTLLALSGRTLDPVVRLRVLMEIMKVVHDDLPILPLVSGVDLYAVREGLEWTPRRDTQVCAFDVRPRG